MAFRCSQLMLMAIICCFWPPNAARADRELPSEAMLPGQRTKQPDLPPESALPRARRLVSVEPKTTPPQAAEPDDAVPQDSQETVESPSDQQVLPSEAELPIAAAPLQLDPPGLDVEAENAQKPGLPPIGTRPNDRPWLRLSMRGHTGMVRAMAFSQDGQRICSAGDDKIVAVWARSEAEKLGRGWLNERTVRWQVQRGPRGRIYALATAPGLVAIGGHGAQGRAGEILLVEPETGDLTRALIDEEHGHQQTVVSLAFSPDPQNLGLASMDARGQAMFWRQNAETGLWQSKQICPPDPERYDAQTARALAAYRRFAPIVLTDAKHAVYAAFQGMEKRSTRSSEIPTWSLERRHLETGETQKLNVDRAHYYMVTALAASADGSKLVSADVFGNVFFWDLRGQPHAVYRQQPAYVVSMQFCDEGKKLLVGTARSPVRDAALVQVWDVGDIESPSMIAEELAEHSVWAIASDPNSSTFAYCQENALRVGDWGRITSKKEELRPRIRPVLGVEFAGEPESYRLTFGSRLDPDGDPILEQNFDLAEVQLGEKEVPLPADRHPDRAGGHGWSIVGESDGATRTYWLSDRGQRKATLPLDPRTTGGVESHCLLYDQAGDPFAVAIGTDRRNHIYVFRLADSGQAPLIRQFRGHAAAVRSLSVSPDDRYLASGSDDATIRVWNLQGLATEDTLGNRWGAAFEPREGELVASFVREDGPLHHRGIRPQDVVTSLRWRDGEAIRNANEPQAMLQALREVPEDTLVVFNYHRNEQEQPSFQMYPAWQPLASLFVSESRDWAFWTPSGYYDASISGHKLFGWQVNHGPSVLPEFFLAAQLRESLERPRVMRQLLKAGSLEGAFRLARLQPPADPQNAVLDEYRLKPRIAILSPAPNAVISGSEVTIRAGITVRKGLQLTSPKAFANGVVASNGREVGRTAVEGGHEIVYEWTARLPAEPKILIQVLAATDAEVAEYESRIIRRQDVAIPKSRQLYVFAAGVDEYRDAQIQRLEYAAKNARTFVATLRERAGTLYESDATLLLNDRATRSMWNVVGETYADRLEKEVSPDDLLVFFLSGHGVRDARTQKYYFVGANASYADIKSEQYEDCISFDDFAQFAKVPCRKLVILDTCHSGAIQQPLRQQDLKAALRSLQDDMLLTVAASDGSQEAIEDGEKQLGRFTYRLIEALQGAADTTSQGGDANGVVSLSETIDYVTDSVRADSLRDPDGKQQYPTAGPVELLEFVSLPLTVSPSVTTGGG